MGPPVCGARTASVLHDLVHGHVAAAIGLVRARDHPGPASVLEETARIDHRPRVAERVQRERAAATEVGERARIEVELGLVAGDELLDETPRRLDGIELARRDAVAEED